MNNNDLNRKIILLVSVIGAFWAPFLTSSINIALPDIGNDLNIGSHVLNWVTSSTVLTVAVFVLPAGKILDIVGNKTMMLIGVIIQAAASLMCGTAQSITILLIGRVFQGVANAIISTCVVTIVFSAFPPNERGKALGINVACTYLGLSLGPVIGGFIISFASWRWIFLSSLFLGTILTVLILKIVSTDELPQEKETFDIKGAVIYGIAIFMTIFGFSNLLLYAWGKYILLSGIILVFIFIFYESKVPNPIIHTSIFKGNRVLGFSLLATLINYSSTYAISFLMSLYLQSALHLTPSLAGIVLLTQPVFQASLSPIAGRLSDKIAPQILASSGMGLITVCLFPFVLFSKDTPIVFIFILLSVIGIGFAFFSSPNTNAIMSSVKKNYFGVASGLIGTARTVGQSVSMSLTALVSSVYLGNLQVTDQTIPAFMMSFKVTFMILTVLCLLGVFFSLVRGKNTINDI